MSHLHKLAAALFCFAASIHLSHAQRPQNAKLREYMREGVREMMKEKWHPATNTPASHAGALAKGTSGGVDQKISAINTTAIQEAEVSLAYRPADSSKLVLSYMEEGPQGLNFPVYFSSNGGQSWTKSSFNTKAILAADLPGQFVGGGGDPVFAWDKNGRVYFSWIYLTVKPAMDTAFFNLCWAYSDDNGNSWTVNPGAQHFIGRGALDANTQDIFNYGDGVTDRQWFAVDNSGGANQGKLYCSYILFPADNNPAHTGESVKSKAFGATSFGPATLAYNGESQFGNVEVASNGTLHLSLGDIANDAIMHVSSTNGGATFSAPHTIGSGNNLFGQTGFVHDRENSAPSMAVDGNGNLHAVWSSFPSGGNYESYYSRSLDGGVTWSSQMALSTKFPGRTAFMPTVAAFGRRVSISMAAVDANDSSSYYQLQSNDNGATWGAAQQLSNAQSNYKSYTNQEFFGDYNRSQRTSCMTYAAWSDGRNGFGPKMYFARTNSCSPTGIGEVTAINGNLQLEALYPNPASTAITLKINAGKASGFIASLHDVTGRRIWQQNKTCKSGTQEIVLPLTQIAAGTYLLTITDSDGTLISRQVSVR